MAYIYFGPVSAIREHDYIIEVSGGFPGVSKPAELGSLLEIIQDDGFYPKYVDKITHLVFSIAKTHYFVDGNKRSSIALGSFFLAVNGLSGLVQVFIVEMENIVLCVADNILSKEHLKVFIEEIIKFGELSESSKLTIINAMQEYEKREKERK